MSKQSIASVTRQVVAVAASIYGVLTASVSTLHLNPAVSAVLTATGPVIIALEHFVADPSTGTAAQAIKVIDATPEVNKIIEEAKAEMLKMMAAARIFIETPATTPPVATPAPVAAVPVPIPTQVPPMAVGTVPVAS